MTVRADGTPGTREPVLANPIEHHVESFGQHSPKVRLVAVDMDCTERPYQVGVSGTRSAPQLATSQLAQQDERLADGAGSADDKKLLPLLNPRVAMQQLVGGHPDQYQCSHFRGVQRRVDDGEFGSLERGVLRVGPDHRQVRDTLSDGRRGHALAELDDLTDEVVTKD